jgi:hypothetical protein
MVPQNRDLLVLTKRQKMNQQELKHEVELLVDILFEAEKLDAFCVANEIIDLNRYKIINKLFVMQKIVRQKKAKPFVFISNKN